MVVRQFILLSFLAISGSTYSFSFIKQLFTGKVQPKLTQSQAFLEKRAYGYGQKLTPEVQQEAIEAIAYKSAIQSSSLEDCTQGVKIEGKKAALVTIMKSCFEQEQKNSKNSVFAYHGHTGPIQLTQDLNKILYAKLNPRINPNNFIFFRNPKTVQELFTPREIKATDHIFDHEKKTRATLLSASMACPETSMGESALYFFTKNTSVITNDIGFSKDLFTSYKLSKPLLVSLLKCYKHASPSFIQIMMPRAQTDLINSSTYISQTFGEPYPTKMLPVDFVDHLRSNPEKIAPGMQQFRLILSSPLFHNPELGAKMIRYTMPTSKEFEEERKELLKRAQEELLN